MSSTQDKYEEGGMTIVESLIRETMQVLHESNSRIGDLRKQLTASGTEKNTSSNKK